MADANGEPFVDVCARLGGYLICLCAMFMSSNTEPQASSAMLW